MLPSRVVAAGTPENNSMTIAKHYSDNIPMSGVRLSKEPGTSANDVLARLSRDTGRGDFFFGRSPATVEKFSEVTSRKICE